MIGHEPIFLAIRSRVSIGGHLKQGMLRVYTSGAPGAPMLALILLNSKVCFWPRFRPAIDSTTETRHSEVPTMRLKEITQRLLAIILISIGFFVSVTQAYVFGRATGELGQSSLSPEFSRLLVSVRRNTVIGFAGGIVILALGEVLLYRSSRGNKGPSDGAPTVVS